MSEIPPDLHQPAADPPSELAGPGKPGGHADAADPASKSPSGAPARDGHEPEDDGGFSSAQDMGAWLQDPEHAHQFVAFLSYLREAVMPFLPGGGMSVTGNVIFGGATMHDVVAGSKHSGATAVGFSGWLGSGQVPDRVLQEVRATFVPPDRYEALQRRVNEEHLLLLRAPAGWGRTMTALHVLEETCPAGVWKLNPEVQLDSLKTDELTAEGGYLVESLEFEQAARLRPFHVESLTACLRKSRCRLVVTLDAAAPLRADLRAESVLDGGPPADPLEIVRRHVTWRLDDPADSRCTDIFGRADIQALLQEASSGALGGRRLAELAASLTDVANGNADLAAVQERFSAEWAAEFQKWFGDQADTDQRAFVIALAVFHGMPAHIVRRAARRLADAAHAARKTDTDVTRAIFGAPQQARLADARAETFDTMEMTAYGQAPTQALRFRDDRYPINVLEHVWAQHEDAHELIISWLRDLGGEDDRRIQVRVGVTAGVFSLFDFDLIRTQLLLPWADSAKKNEREAAVGALKLPSRHPQLAPLISRMVADWCQPTRSLPFRWTATRALGASIGGTMAGRALRLLARAADSGHGLLTAAICDSVTELFTDQENDLAGLVLDALLRWTASEQPERRTAGVLCLLQIGHDLVVDVPPGTIPWPALVWLAQRDEVQFEQIVTLLRRALNAPHVFHLGYEVLRAWVRTAERDDQLHEPLGRIITGLTEDSYERENLAHYLERWNQEQNPPARTITALLAAIDEREQGRGP